ncbi:Methionyl-tRNA formyltransferase, mitochondrial [Tolypocladium ophioglossoides CBS 100239]|uniref:methionyl-tRNA formyltransferase n=1 Tax=Tolypocladium ophioglossoides (strain CBS 100239) TaxID=1163406 RepID=A0A0L0N6K9_TOLOC|nr:Methionyl-tRNA formyltransferase, mitochondrial [Tolypocladium ophioglossoides CBS 100239]
MSPPPSTPTPRRFLLPKRSTQTAQTPAQYPQFQSTPWFGSSSALRPTQRRGHDIEVVDEDDDGSQDGLLEDEAVGDDARGQYDSIEVESDAASASQHDEVSSQGRCSDLDLRDDIEANPLEVDHTKWSPEGREAKRQKVFISPVPDSEPPTRQHGDADPIPDDENLQREESEEMGSLDDADSDRYSPAEAAAARAAHQPVFQPAPRFKPVETHQAMEGLPAAFSPQRRGAKYLPDGLAAELQGWLSEVKGWEGIDRAADSTLRITIEEVRPGRQMYLARGRPSAGQNPQRLILAGEGKLTGLGRRAVVAAGSVVMVGQPVWDVELDGEMWTVACDWSVNDEPVMLRPLSRPLVGFCRNHHTLYRQRFPSAPANKASDPLRILFCGSDAFSCESLRALHGEHVRDGRLVEALDVMVLPPRRTGRGFKQIREVPCKAVAEELGLRVHQRDTFRRWELPEGTNLIIVVSFGLFVPPRILSSAKYGGLNVHPSLLPDLRGPAPIHHAMLRGDEHIGISLQTLDDRAFDHGTVLAQTPAPGLAMQPGASIQEVIHEAAVQGAQMLVQGLRDGVHVPPHVAVGGQLHGREPTHAPKVTKADAQVDWARWTSAEEFTRRVRVFSSVWTRAVADQGEEKRVLFQDVEAAARDEVSGTAGATVVFAHEDGRHERAVVVDEAEGAVAVCIGDGVWVRVRRVRVDGRNEQDAARALRPFLRKRSV